MAGRAPPSSFVEKTLAFASLLWRRFDDDRCLPAAASLSYTSLLAIVPLSAIVVSITSAFPVFGDIQAEIQEFFVANFLPSAVSSVQSYVSEFAGKARGLTAVGIVGLAVVALLLFVTIEAAVNVIFQVSEQRALVPRLLVFWAILTLGPLLIGASFSIATYLVAYTRSLALGSLSEPLGLFTRATPTVLVIAAFTLFYMIIPNRPVRFTHALAGAIVAGLLFSFLRWAFTFYVTNFPTYQTLYGALATIPIFLFWMYLSWAVVLAGAVLTAALPHWGRSEIRGDIPTEPVVRLTMALTVLSQLYRSLEGGRGLARRDLLRSIDAADLVIDAMLAELRAQQFVDVTETGRWLPTRDPTKTTLYDLFHALGLDLRVEHIAETASGDLWGDRLRDLVRIDEDRQKTLMSVDLRALLLAPADAPVDVAEASPEKEAPAEGVHLPLRRTL